MFRENASLDLTIYEVVLPLLVKIGEYICTSFLHTHTSYLLEIHVVNDTVITRSYEYISIYLFHVSRC